MTDFSQAGLLDAYRIEDRTAARLRVNFIASLDGAATHDGLSGGLNNADDKLVFDTLRTLADVILVGAGTVRAEGYGGIRLDAAAEAWRVAHGLPPQPRIAVVSGRLDLEAGHPLFTDAATRPIAITHAGSPADKRADLEAVADVLVCGAATIDLPLALRELAARGLRQVLCEGGPSLFGALLTADAVDELCLSLSPVLEAGTSGRIAHSAAAASRPMRLGHVLTAGDMLFLRYTRPSP
ncbi:MULTISPECIES: pyrimidine reductase family protein [unclassified Cryobacterium]|uniref:pyrimidine reductase family protein n=1 Tax=unclassified Cryobacterium TaxID=2649013 RepID=UPI001069614E|nr:MULTISPECIES: pyrimidine reductase family protein [unclassified Cryobacterium]TFB98578.1 pyrimidine reductase family protein [Cryobacterium sp. MDB2-A-1]TFC08461.1 pyrimidine reductase family protein [Cryobacterium sp. MDB2-33-2]TFC08727.1 pyrimidine reductase family protein [Cryobacterium sp. MDB2-A-2]TFC22217.1 pyrimidine reductase family protein [Cryobacterium sp. MDB2-10]